MSQVARRFFILETLLALCIALLVLQLSWPSVREWLHRPRPGAQVAQDSVPYNYLIYLPADYGRQDQRWPLLVFLHGSGQRGDELSKVPICGPPALIARGKSFPMVVVSPQCPSDQDWQPVHVNELVDGICHKFAVDQSRIYLTGYSMGGYGTWSAGIDAPNRFAALIPVSGGGDREAASKLVKVPVWAFHGGQDKVVPVSMEKQMVDAVQAAGGEARLTVYPDKAHGICNLPYQEPQLLEWLLAQRRP